MATKKTKRSTSKAKGIEEWNDPEIFVFAGERGLPVGAMEQHSLSEFMGDLFGKRKEDVQVEWQKIVGQIHSLIDSVSPRAKNFSLDEISFELGFSAEGHIVFVAKAGVQTTISAKFKRKQ